MPKRLLAIVAASIALGGFGAVLVLNQAGAASVTSSIVPITPCRLVDTRPAPDHVGALPGALFRAKIVEESMVRSGPIPYTIVRATQFYEFLQRIADTATTGDTVRLPPARIQPMATRSTVRRESPTAGRQSALAILALARRGELATCTLGEPLGRHEAARTRSSARRSAGSDSRQDVTTLNRGGQVPDRGYHLTLVSRVVIRRNPEIWCRRADLHLYPTRLARGLISRGCLSSKLAQ